MLPFLKKTQEASASYNPDEVIKRESDSEEDGFDSLESAAEDLLQGIHSKDIKAIAAALRAAFELCDSEPHEEGEHI